MTRPRAPFLFRAMLWLYPARVRRLDGDDMWDTFHSHLEEARHHGIGATSLLWANELGAALGRGLAERARQIVFAPRLEPLLQDVRSGVRSLARTPITTAAVVLTLALGIGANVAVYSVVYAVLWRSPQQVHEPAQLVRVDGIFQDDPMPLSYAAYMVYRDQAEPFESLVAFWPITVHLHDGQPAGRLRGMLVSDNYFHGLRVTLARGRWVVAPEGRDPACCPFAVISHRLWQQQFGGREYVLNHFVRLNGQRFRIVGVAPRGFTGLGAGDATDVWVSLGMSAEVLPGRPDWSFEPGAFPVSVVGRLRPETDQDAAEASIASVEIPTKIGQFYHGGATLTSPAWASPQQSELLEPMATLMFGTVAIVLAIACANLAGLLLVRGDDRTRELTIRAALGATRARIFRHLLIEGALLTGVGTLVGLAIARGTSGLLRGYELAPGVRTSDLDLSVDSSLLLFVAALAAIAGMCFSIVPALVASRSRHDLVLRAPNDSGSPARMGSALAVAQMGASVALLLTASTLLAGVSRLQAVDLGFDAEGVLRASVDLELDDISEDGRPGGVISGVVSRGFVTEEISASAAADRSPLGFPRHGPVAAFIHRTNATTSTASPDGARLRDAGVRVRLTSVTPRYHWTLQIPLRGRPFYDTDRADSEPVAIISEVVAQELWPDGDAVGGFLRIGHSRRPTSNNEIVRIVGVAGNVQHITTQDAPVRELYRPLAQRPTRAVTFFWRSDDAEDATERLRATVRYLDAGTTLYDVGPLDRLVPEAISSDRFAAAGVGAFAAVAIALAAVGLYGVLAQVAAQRRREFGIRAALGAPRGRLRNTMLGYAGRHALAGIALGSLGGWMATQVLDSQLPGLGELPPAYWLGVIGIVLATTLVATLGPARSATTVDPTEALRAD